MVVAKAKHSSVDSRGSRDVAASRKRIMRTSDSSINDCRLSDHQFVTVHGVESTTKINAEELHRRALTLCFCTQPAVTEDDVCYIPSSSEPRL